MKRKVNAKDYQIYDLSVLKQWSLEDVRRTLKVTAYQVYNARSRVARKLKAERKYLEDHLYRVEGALALPRQGYVSLTNGVAGALPVNTFIDTTATNVAAFYWIEQE